MKSHDYHDVIVFEYRRLQNVFRLHLNEEPAFSYSLGLKNIFGKLRFRDGLVWKVGLTVASRVFGRAVWMLLECVRLKTSV